MARPRFLAAWAPLLLTYWLCTSHVLRAAEVAKKSSYSYCTLDSAQPWIRTAVGLDEESFETVAPILSYKFKTSERQVRQSLSYYGSSTRFRKFVADLQAGTRPLKVSLIGGSHSWAASALSPGVDDWLTMLRKWLESVSKAQITVRNSCIPGTTPGYLAMCLDTVLEAGADLILVEYTPNVDIDNHVLYNSFVMDLEKLVQRLLRLPGLPAVVLVNSPHMAGLHDRFSHTMEDLEGAITTYYGIPAISARPAQHCLVTAVRDAAPNAGADAGANLQGGSAIDVETAKRFVQLMTAVHGGSASHTVQQALADTAVHLFQTAAMDLVHNPITKEEDVYRARPVPAPMYSDSKPPQRAVCLAADSFKAAVSTSPGWTWANQGLDVAPRWAFSTTAPLSKLTIPLGAYMYDDTTSTTAADAAVAVAAAPQLHVSVHFLKSHADMGQATLACSGACRCGAATVDGRLRVPLVETSASWVTVSPMAAGPKRSCDLILTVLNATSSGGHKFAVTSLGVGVMPPPGPAPAAGQGRRRRARAVAQRAAITTTFLTSSSSRLPQWEAGLP